MNSAYRREERGLLNFTLFHINSANNLKYMSMENGNKPITPLQHEGYPSHESVIDKDCLIGLTKREYFAAMAMQGMLAAGYGDFNNNHVEYISELAIKQADELLKQLSPELLTKI